MSTAPFILEKHYFDAVTAGGLCIIGYRAEVRYRAVRVRLAAAMISRAEGPVEQRLSLRGGAEPVRHGESLRWSCTAVGVELELRPAMRGGAVRLHESPSGKIDWECLTPAAKVRVLLDGEPHEATGYAERIVMTLPPHRLPIRTLRWGRFVADDASAGATWIQWRGARDLGLILDGRGLAARADIGATECSWVDAGNAEHRLAFDSGRTIREGVVGATVLQIAPVVRRLAPPIARAVLGIREHKRLARGTLAGPDGSTARGWVVHEVVEFPGDRT